MSDKPRELYHEDIKWVPKLAYVEAVQRVKFIHELLIEKEKQVEKLAEALEFAIDGHSATQTLFTERDFGSMVKANIGIQKAHLIKALAEYRGEE